MAKNQVVSIDIGTSAIKLAQLEQTASGIRLVNAGIETYPYASPATEIPTEVISETLQRLWRGISGRSTLVVLSIPRLSVTSRRLTNLPAAATEDQLSNLVSMQAETELPFRVEDAIYDYHGVHRSEDTISAELIAARGETVQQQITETFHNHPIMRQSNSRSHRDLLQPSHHEAAQQQITETCHNHPIMRQFNSRS